MCFINFTNTTMLGLGPVFDQRSDSNPRNATCDYANDATLMRWVVFNMDMYLVPVIITIGIIGNGISFLVFVMTPIKALSSSVYLAALGISDNGFLLCVLGGWLVNVDFSFYQWQGLCQLFIYFTYVFGFLSVWYVVAFTVERYVAVCFPFRRNEMCTTRRAKIVVICLALFAVVVYNPLLWTSTVDEQPDTKEGAFCHVVTRFKFLVEIVNYIDTTLTFIIPSIAIVAINTRIVHHVVSMQRHNKEILSTIPSDGSNNSETRYFTDRRTGQNAQITRLLLIVSTMFLLLNLPNHVLRFHLFIMQVINPNNQPSINYQQLKVIFQHIYYLNFCINFVLYSLCGRNFRKALQMLFSRKLRHQDALVNVCQDSPCRRYRNGKFSCLSEEVVMATHVDGEYITLNDVTKPCEREQFICLERNNFITQNIT